LILSVQIVRNITELSYEIKLLQSFLCLSVCILHYIYTKRKTYSIIYLYGFIFWGLIELALALRGIRNGTFISPDFFGFEIGYFVSALLRGSSEGGMPTLLAIIVSDSVMRLDRKRKLLAIRALAVFIFFSIFIPMVGSWESEKIIGNGASSRNVFSILSVLVLGLMIAYSLIWMYLYADKFEYKRVAIMSITLIVLSLLWNFAGYIMNVRWVEFDAARAGILLEFFILLPFQALFEVAGPYILFYILPRSLNHINESHL